MDLKIRNATMEDLDLLVAWRMEVLSDVFPEADYVIPPDLEEKNRAYYEAALPAGRHIACFASLNGEIIGCGGLCLEEEMPSPDNPGGHCAYLMNIYCRPPYRKQGVGSAIVTHLVDEAKARSITKIYLETSPEGRRLYQGNGFVPMPDMMILPGQV